MNIVELPVSKSIANRLLILQALHKHPLLNVSGVNVPDDVRVMHDCLEKIHNSNAKVVRLDVKNCGTAMRFLMAYCAQRAGKQVIIDGCERMHHRPVLQEEQALTACGAEIWYETNAGYPPVHVRGKRLIALDTYERGGVRIYNPRSSQYVSALLLIGIDVKTNSRSPYIDMTRELIAHYDEYNSFPIEKDWSAAAFWYEYVALHGGKILLKGLRQNSVQGDKIVAQWFERLGVVSTYSDEGVIITRKEGKVSRFPVIIDFTNHPDLYPSIALTCKRMGIWLIAKGTDSLRIKESDRLKSLSSSSLNHEVCSSFHDHRVAMALLAADYACDDKQCIEKSYPLFCDQLTNVQASV